MMIKPIDSYCLRVYIAYTELPDFWEESEIIRNVILMTYVFTKLEECQIKIPLGTHVDVVFSEIDITMDFKTSVPISSFYDQFDVQDKCYESTYQFKEIEDIIQFVHRIPHVNSMKSSLFYYDRVYILYHKFDSENDYLHIVPFLEEYGSSINVSYEVLKEYGKSIITERATDQIRSLLLNKGG
ncbi:adaptor protein MecA [Brevibacillus halotolerans]|uniref:adaptor protein MecA n=1 Tax=Brevibacillus halotolerans TaxID=1507437 RepID=UPI0015EF3A3A|nr:adaptor protein MecA [Brevibacillus halotolerans]MBA4533829.1 adaptor protein MecA [Brevibacillus halotolerans]